jgi:hypothetical protein
MEQISLREYRILRDRTGCSCWWKLPMDAEGFRAHVALPHPYWIRCVASNKVWQYTTGNADEWQAWYLKVRNSEAQFGRKVERGTTGDLEHKM